MKSLEKCAFIAFFALVLVVAPGCLTDLGKSIYRDFFGAPREIPPEFVATYFDGPKVKPGIAVSISVTATGTKGHSSQQYFVDAEGYISMELLGAVKVDGLGLIELQQMLTEKFKEYYLDPHVTATFVTGGGAISPWGSVTVMGEVGRQGPVDMPATQELRLTQALLAAGGASPSANKRNIWVTRADRDGKQTRTKVDLVEIGEDGRADKDMLLKAGDVVWVPLSWY
ncbi:MAG: polysaccharide biosynthesis/export family protein [Kiritimatiellae bacterium]|nr:polysaccharide biosynthesis/export family protein [Kiritimatiellia bacterium]